MPTQGRLADILAPRQQRQSAGWSSVRLDRVRRQRAAMARTAGRRPALQSLGGGGAVVTETRVVVADDDVLLREGLASLLARSGLEVVGQAGDASELLALARKHAPDLVVVDIRMPPTYSTEGLDAARVIREELPETGILLLSAHVVVEHAMELLASGHRVGYLLKRRVTDVDEF